MSIIEKLGISKNEKNLIKALLKGVEGNGIPCGKDCNAPNGCDCWINEMAWAIKLTTNKSWEEIKELISK